MLYTNQEIAKRRKKKIKIKRIVAMILYIILIPIMIYNISLIIQSLYNPNKTPSFLGIKTYVIISGSMEPKINIGDMVIAKNIKNEEEAISVGDIIAFRKGESVITHRIVRIEKDENEILRITTKGDNNNTNDRETILINNIEGKVITVIPKIGTFILIFQKKIIIIIILIMCYICISHSDNAKKRKMERRLKRQEYEKKTNIDNKQEESKINTDNTN